MNLNLLPVLRELLRKRNVTHAAEALNMSQPAVSEALGRLRHLFQDEILAPQGRKLELTAFAERMAPMLEASLAPIEALIGAPAFDPAEISGSIKIATVDYVVLLFGNELIRLLSEIAPKITVHFFELTPESGEDLKKGALDFIIDLPHSETAGLERTLLFDDEVICIVAEDSHLTNPVDEDSFWRARHVAYSPGDATERSLHAAVMHQTGRQEFNAMLVQSFLLLPFLVENSDTVAIVQRRLANRLAIAAKVRIIRPPVDFPPLHLYAMWSRSRSNDPLHQWFRATMVTAASGRTGTDLDAQA